MTTADSDPTPVRLLNRLGEDMQNSGFSKVAASISRLPDAFFDAADVAGLIYNTPLLEARLARYPALLSIAERPEFQDLANDKEFSEMRVQRKPLRDVIDYPKAQAILGNTELLKSIWETLKPDLKDLAAYLLTLKSEKYGSEHILGRWNVDVHSAIASYRRLKPNIASTEMQRVRRVIEAAFSKGILVAMPDHHAVLKNVAQLSVSATSTPANGQSAQGQWSKSDEKYQFTFSLGGREEQAPAKLDGDRLTITSGGTELAFLRED